MSVDLDLTENEGSLLGMIARLEPKTAYQLIKAYEQSPDAKINSSKGAVYPQIRRLKARGFIETETVPGDKRNSELIWTTDLGREALRNWVRTLGPDHTLLPDPIRSRMMLLDLLPSEEQVDWIIEAKRLLVEKKQEVQEFARHNEVPYGDIVLASAVSSIDVKMQYMDDLLARMIKAGDVRVARTS